MYGMNDDNHQLESEVLDYTTSTSRRVDVYRNMLWTRNSRTAVAPSSLLLLQLDFWMELHAGTVEIKSAGYSFNPPSAKSL